MFDVDGTLTLTEETGDVCWARSIEETFGIANPDTEWTHYTHVTDVGVTLEVCRKRLRRAPTAEEIAEMRRRYVACIRRAAKARPSEFGTVPGANEILRWLPRHGWSVAIATGAWRACFLAKVSAAGLRLRGIPVATSDDEGTRPGIVRAAIGKAAQAARVSRFPRVVALGDGVWDARAARRLEIGFVGVTASGGAAKMRREGVVDLVRDFRRPEALLALLEAARPPRPTSARDS